MEDSGTKSYTESFYRPCLIPGDIYYFLPGVFQLLHRSLHFSFLSKFLTEFH